MDDSTGIPDAPVTYLATHPGYRGHERLAGERARPISSDMSSDETDAKIAASEARGETSLVRAMAELRSHTDSQVAKLQLAQESLIGDVRTGFAQINGRFDTIDTKFDGVDKRLDSFSGIKATIIVTVIATGLSVAGLVFTGLSYGGQLFSLGMDTQAAADQAARQAVEHAQQQPKPSP